MSAVETAGLRLRPIEKRLWPPVYWSTLNAQLTDGLDSHSWFYYEDEGVGFETF